jgi:hypothetical protein
MIYYREDTRDMRIAAPPGCTCKGLRNAVTAPNDIYWVSWIPRGDGTWQLVEGRGVTCMHGASVVSTGSPPAESKPDIMCNSTDETDIGN